MMKRVGVGALCLLAGGLPGLAADLDAPRRGPPVVLEGFGPPPGVFAPRRPSPPCRVIAQPEFNLSQDDVVRTRPQLVCLSRGLYGDTANQP